MVDGLSLVTTRPSCLHHQRIRSFGEALCEIFPPTDRRLTPMKDLMDVSVRA